MPTWTIHSGGGGDFLTLAAAVAASGPGDTLVFLDSAIYVENSIDCGAKGLRIRVAAGQTPMMDGGAGNVRCLYNLGVASELHDLRFWRYQANWGFGSGVVNGGGGHIVAEDCIFLDCLGVAFVQIAGTAIDHAKIRRCSVQGGNSLLYSFGVGSHYVDVENCRVRTTTGPGIVLHDSTCTAKHCSVWVTTAGADGIDCNLGTPVSTNCAVKHSAGSMGRGIDGEANSCVVHGFATGWLVDGGGNQAADPLFVNPAADDFSVPIASPCVNHGEDAGITEDAEGTTRPIGGAYDVGALELPYTALKEAEGRVQRVVVDLHDIVTVTAGLINPANWTCAPSGPGATPTVSLVVPKSTVATDEVTLHTTDHTKDAGYVTTFVGTTNVLPGSATYTGDALPPTVASAEFTNETTLRVTFSKPMATTDLSDPSKYTVHALADEEEALSVASATPEVSATPSWVDLSVGGAYPGRVYVVHVSDT